MGPNIFKGVPFLQEWLKLNSSRFEMWTSYRIGENSWTMKIGSLRVGERCSGNRGDGGSGEGSSRGISHVPLLHDLERSCKPVQPHAARCCCHPTTGPATTHTIDYKQYIFSSAFCYRTPFLISIPAFRVF